MFGQRFGVRQVELINSGIIYSIDKVKKEIDKGGDELTDWVHNNAPHGFFLKQDSIVSTKLAETIAWAENNPINFTKSALFEYASVADSYLVATAEAKDMILVTYEKSNLERRSRVMIPDTCNAIGVRSCDLNTVFRELRILI